jgi:hypothetical protein
MYILFELMEDYLVDQEDGMKKLLTWFLNLVMRREAIQQSDADPYELNDEGTARINGHKSRSLNPHGLDYRYALSSEHGHIVRIATGYILLERSGLLACSIQGPTDKISPVSFGYYKKSGPRSEHPGPAAAIRPPLEPAVSRSFFFAALSEARRLCYDPARSKRSRFITFVQAATKS